MMRGEGWSACSGGSWPNPPLGKTRRSEIKLIISFACLLPKITFRVKELMTGPASAASAQRLRFRTLGASFFLLLVLCAAPARADSPRLFNISTRGQVGVGADVMIAGLVVGPGSPNTVLIRAVGPSLAQYVPQGVSGLLEAPVLSLFDSSGALVQSNQADGAANKIPGSCIGTVTRGVLEAHFLRGSLAAVGRRSDFSRLYDLAERVIPAEHRSRHVEYDAGRRALLLQAARAHAVGTARDLADYFRMSVGEAKPLLRQLVESGQLHEVQVESWREIAYPWFITSEHIVNWVLEVSPETR